MKENKLISFRLPNDLYELVDQRAQLLGISRTDYMLSLISKDLGDNRAVSTKAIINPVCSLFTIISNLYREYPNDPNVRRAAEELEKLWQLLN